GDRVWAILKKCWSYHPGKRPSVESVRSEIDPTTDRESSEEVRSGMETMATKNLDPKEHLSTAADQSIMEPMTTDNLDPMDWLSTGAMLDEMETIRAENLDAMGGPSSEAVWDKVETISPEHRKRAGSELQKLFSQKKKKGNS
ncbi:unnamed protein product, partial [Rhizoctonia solani]